MSAQCFEAKYTLVAPQITFQFLYLKKFDFYLSINLPVL